MTGADVVVIGGGIQGATMALAAARHGRRVLLLERGALADGATGNSYGIVHGGLRYLQTLDVARWHRSRGAQHWFRNHYPQRVKPLPCVMPLYRGRLRSPAAFRAAGRIEGLLTRRFGIDPALPRLSVLPAEAMKAGYPVPRDGLTGGARWFDLELDDARRLVDDILRDAGLAAGDILTGVEAEGLVMDGPGVAGVRIRHVRDGSVDTVDCRTVIDCRGAATAPLDGGPGGADAAVLAFNLLFDLPFEGEEALAVSESPGRGRSYFLRSRSGGTFTGTFYRPVGRDPQVLQADIDAARAALERAMPGIGFASAPILDVTGGLLPADGAGDSPNDRDHVSIDRPHGYHRLVGVKLTTAPLLSFDVAERLFGKAA